jgi:hypothetical protein
MRFTWNVSTKTDPRTTQQSLMLSLAVGNMVVGFEISADTARKLGKDLTDGAAVLDGGVLAPSQQETKIFSA